MQLIIDIGNTRVKLALFDKNELVNFQVFNNTQEVIDNSILSEHSISNCILVSVVDNEEKFILYLKNKIPVHIYTNTTPTPIINKYATPNTLGADRLASVVGANNMFPNKNILLIDVGTCIKYNFISEKNEFIGGSISPGLEMRLKAINAFTAHLPLLERDDEFDTLIANTTEGNILSGVELGAIAEVDGIISKYLATYPNLKIILTGGDYKYFEKQLKKGIFVEPFITLNGLNVILNYNTSSQQSLQ